MRVLHFSTTPLVGAPGRICRALREQLGVDARWVVLNPEVGAYGQMRFELDWTWDNNRDEVIAFAGRCDVWHLHNFLDVESAEFAPLSFKDRWHQGRAMLRHFHSTPDLIAQSMPDGARRLRECPLPKLVIAQYPERFMPDAKLVPNVVFPLPKETDVSKGRLRIGYAPSRFNSGRSARWDTKGYPETLKVLRKVEQTMRSLGQPLDVDVIEQVPHAECLQRKARCQIVIDDLVTGSYHLNTLESLADGSVCLTYLDRRTQQALAELIGRFDFPALSVGVEDAVAVLVNLCKQPDIVRGIGRDSREWMLKHWNPKVTGQVFVDAYAEIVASPGKQFVARAAQSEHVVWARIGLHDALWRSRQRRWPRLPPAWAVTLRGAVGRVLRRVRFLQ